MEILEKSNIFSVSENLLLKWLEVNYQKRTRGKQAKRLRNFNELKDGLFFEAVL